MSDTNQRLREIAPTLGFSMLGVTPAQPSPRLQAYLDWIHAGMHGEMGYMARDDRVARRRDLNLILPHAQSVIVVGLDYYSLKLPDQFANDPGRGRFSNYAWSIDYHEVMLPQLEKLADFIRSETGAPCATRCYVNAESRSVASGLLQIAQQAQMLYSDQPSAV